MKTIDLMMRVMIVGLVAGIAVAQNDDARDAATIDKDVRALLTAEIHGDPVGALTSLQQSISAAGADAPLRLRARLVALLEEAGEPTKALDEAKKLASAREPYGSWAKVRASQLSSVLQQQAVAGDDPLLRLILKLDGTASGTESDAAYRAKNELNSLGVLVAPVLRKHITKVGPVGARAILELLTSSPDDELPGFIESLLGTTGDQGYLARLAADAIRYLPAEPRKRLGDRAAGSPIEALRIAGLTALATIPSERPRVVAAIRELVESPKTLAPRTAIVVLGLKSMSAVDEVGPLLEAWAASPNADIATTAVRTWMSRNDGITDAVASAFFARLPEPSKSAFITATIDFRIKWPSILIQGLASERTRNDALNALQGMSADVPAAAIASLLQFTPDGHNARPFSLLRRCQDSGAEDIVVEQLARKSFGTTEDRRTAVDYVRRVAPKRLIPLLGDLLYYLAHEDGQEVLRTLIEQGDSSVVGPLTRALITERIPSIDGPKSVRAFAVDAIAKWNDASTLPSLQALLAARLNDPTRALVLERLPASVARWLTPSDVPALLKALDGAQDVFVEAFMNVAKRKITADQLDAAVALAESTTHEALATGLVYMIAQTAGKNAATRLTPLITHKLPAIRVEAVVASAPFAKDADFDRIATVVREAPPETLARLLEAPNLASNDAVRAALVERIVAGSFTSSDVERFLRSLGGSGAAVAREILALARDRRPPAAEEVVFGALTCTVPLPEAALPEVTPFLMHAELSVRLAAVRAALSTYSMRAVPHLIEALKDPEPQMRGAANEALKSIRDYLSQKAEWEAWTQSRPTK